MAASDLLRRGWGWLARSDLAALLIALLLLAVALGSLFPQAKPGLALDAQEMARWRTALQARYGPLLDPLAAARVFNLGTSPLIWLPLALLAAATLACTTRRWPRPWRLTGRARWSGLAAWTEHVAILLLLVGATVTATFGWQQELNLAPGERVRAGGQGGLDVQQRGFAVERYADGSPAGYQVDLQTASDAATQVGMARVNRPLRRNGIVLYLTGYQPVVQGYRVTLLAVHDPGYGLVIAAGCLFLAAVTTRVALRQ